MSELISSFLRHVQHTDKLHSKGRPMSSRRTDIIVIGDKARHDIDLDGHKVDTILLEDIYQSLKREWLDDQ